MSLLNIKSLILFLIFIPYSAVQSETLTNQFKSKKSHQVAMQLQRTINEKLQKIIALEVAAGGEATEIDYGLIQKSQSSHERFGAVISPNTKGLVLSVTPNSPAVKLGLISGDTIVSVNDILLAKSNIKELIDQHYLENNHLISLEIIRDNRSQYLSGKLSALTTPVWTLSVDKINPTNVVTLVSGSQKDNKTCGRIIIGKYMPREEDTPYRSKAVFIKEIDGVKQRTLSGGFRGNSINGYLSMEKKRFKLATGKHKIAVAPRYNKNTKHINIIDGENTEFLMTIAANTSYYLVYDTRKDSPYSKTNTPIVWQTKTQPCDIW